MSPDPEPQAVPQLPQARIALERGDYGQVVRLLTTADGITPTNKDAELLLLLATAWMGLGRNEEALLCCRRLRASNDPSLCAQARELQRVLEAPALERPREWSLTLPDLGSSEAAMGRQLSSIKRTRRPKPPPPPPPAVGPTQAPLGFAVVVSLLVLLGLLLGGCGAVRSELAFSGAGRLQLHHHLLQQGAQPPPLQQTLVQQLRQQGFQARSQGRELVLSTPVLPTRLVLERLDQSIAAATALAGLPANPCQLGGGGVCATSPRAHAWASSRRRSRSRCSRREGRRARTCSRAR